MRFSFKTSKVEICKRVEDVGCKCRIGDHSRWADSSVTLDGLPLDCKGVNCGLVAQAIYNDPTYLPAVLPRLPREDSVLLVSDGLLLATFTIKTYSKLIPMDLGPNMSNTVVSLKYSPTEPTSFSALIGSSLIVQTSKGGKVVRLVQEPSIWACLLEVYSLEYLFTLPPRFVTPKLPMSGAWLVVVTSKPEIPQKAIRHILETDNGMYVTARGITNKEIKRRVEKTIQRLGVPDAIYRKDILDRR